MSRLAAFNLLGRIGSQPMLLAPNYAGSLGAAIREMMTVPDEGAATVGGDKLTQSHLRDVCTTWGATFEDRKPYGFAAGAAIIPVHGSLINRFNASWGFVTGYQYVEGAIEAAMADPQVQGIVLDVDSFGGEVQGCFELCDMIFKSRRQKPINAIVNANAYSAAYAVASSASKIIVTPSGGAGSIGVVTMHVDYSAALKEDGIKVTFIHAGKHKVDGNPYEPLSAGVKKEIQDRINASYEEFVSLVATNRSLDPEAVKDTEARIYRADEALALGLIDAVEAAPAALRSFVTELSGSKRKEYTMSTTPEKPAATVTEPTTAESNLQAPVNATVSAADAAQAERDRISAILGDEEAGGRAALATHLALSTNLTAEQAHGVLAKAAKETPQVAAQPAASPFVAAMNAGKHPDVGVLAETADPDAPVNRVAEMLASLSKATGQKFDRNL